MIITERDKKMLKELYEIRALGAGQIKRAFYEGNGYGYNRIRQLHKNGYLDGKPFVEGRKKVTQVYWVTNKAIKEVGIPDARAANKNKPQNHFLMKRQLLINEVYVRIRQLEEKNQLEAGSIWEWRDSRYLKTSSLGDINRGDTISAGLLNKTTGEIYGVYLPGRTVNDAEQLEKLQAEIDRHKSLRNNIIFCTDEELFKTYSTIKPTGRSLKIMPHLSGINIFYNLYTAEDALKKAYSEYLGIKLEDIRNETMPFATHSTDEYYLTEYLTGDIMIKFCIRNMYMLDKGSNKHNPLKILCWDFQVKELSTWASDEKIELCPITFQKSEIGAGIEINQTQMRKRPQAAKTVVKEKSNRARSRMTLSFPPAVGDFLNTYKRKKTYDPKITASDIATKGIMALDEYKEYIRKQSKE